MTKKRIAPTEDWNDVPLAITMQVSSAWISVVIKELLWLTSTDVWYGDQTERDRASQAIQEIIVALGMEGSIGIVEIGTIITSALDAPPTGYLDCDGAALSRTTYAALFSAIGTKFGSGDGTTTFNMPDLRNKFVKGANADAEIGNTGGEAQVTLTTSKMPSHRHQIKDSASNTLYRFDGGGSNALVMNTLAVGQSQAFQYTEFDGQGEAHENEPPYLKLNHFIKF